MRAMCLLHSRFFSWKKKAAPAAAATTTATAIVIGQCYNNSMWWTARTYVRSIRTRANKRMSERTEVHGKKLYCANRMFDVHFSRCIHCDVHFAVCTRFDTWSIAKMQQLQPPNACKLTLFTIFRIDEAINCATLSKHCQRSAVTQSNGKSLFGDFVRKQIM